MPSDLDYMMMACARDPVKYGYLKPEIERLIREEEDYERSRQGRQLPSRGSEEMVRELRQDIQTT